MSLPFPDNSFDAVINIESSHCYPSREQFFAETARVLRTGGLFLYADMILPLADSLTLDQVNNLLNNSGLTVIKAEDISENVLKSRDLLSESNLFEEAMSGWLKDDLKKHAPGLVSEFRRAFFLKGSSTYKSLKAGEIVYLSWILKKQI